MRPGQKVFVDSGAWIALALSRDPMHEPAKSSWQSLRGTGARLHTSVPVILETFTFLDRNAARDVALAWKESLDELDGLEVHPCSAEEMDEAWAYFRRSDLHKLSAVDATSFVIMGRHEIRVAFAFDHHFAMAGFRMVG
jgi:predicted nucleic acid-binding protein